MAGSVNRVTLIGNLGRDVEVRTTQNGAKIGNMTVATSEQWKDRDGNKQERTEWHRVSIFNEHLVKIAEQYLSKGSKVYLEGQLQTRKWTDQSGVEKYSTEIVLGKFKGELQLLDSKQGGRDEHENQDAHTNQDGTGGPQRIPESDLDDPLPF